MRDENVSQKLPDWLKNALIFLTTMVGIIVAIVELVKFYQNDFELVFAISGTVIFLLIWYLCWHFYLTNDRQILKRVALLGVILVPISFIIGVILFLSSEPDDTSALVSVSSSGVKTHGTAGGGAIVTDIVLVNNVAPGTTSGPPIATDGENLIVVASFYVADQTADREVHHEIRRAIQKQIDTLSDASLRVEVEDTRLRADARDEALKLGQKYNANIVIWGEDIGTRITVNYLNLADDTKPVEISEADRTQLENPSGYAHFVTEDLPAQLTFLSLFAIGHSYYNQEQYPQAAALIEKAVAPLTPEMNPPEDIADAYFRLGWLYQSPMKDQTAAIYAYGKAIELNADNAIYYFNRGTAYLRLKEYQQAIADYDRAIMLNPNYYQAYYNRGNVYYALSEPENAITNYEMAIKLKPNYVKALNNLCWVGTLSIDPPDVIDVCDKAVELAEESEMGLMQDSRGVARVLTGDYDGAIADFQAYIEWLKASNRYEPGAQGREAWIEMLEQGQNPLDDETRRVLLYGE